MNVCKKCDRRFPNKQALSQHNSRNSNCTNKCSNCLYLFRDKRALTKHNLDDCEPRYQCEHCNIIYKSKYSLKYHLEDCPAKEPKKIQNENNNNMYLLEQLPEKDRKEINNVVQNIQGQGGNQPVIVQINNNKIEINNNINNKIKIKNNFMETKPNNFDYDRFDKIEYQKYSEHNEQFDEKLLDLYMNNERYFRENCKEHLHEFDKEKLNLDGFHLLHAELLKDPKHRNIRIKKSKSGKCFIYRGKWDEVPLKKTMIKLCGKLCNAMYDVDSNMYQYLRLVMASQPKRLTSLRKNIEKNILNLNNMPQIEDFQEDKLLEM